MAVRRPSEHAWRRATAQWISLSTINDFVIVSAMHKIIADGQCMLLASHVQRFSPTAHLMSFLSTDLPAQSPCRYKQTMQVVINGFSTFMGDACTSALWSESSVHWFTDEAQGMSEHSCVLQGSLRHGCLPVRCRPERTAAA